VAPILLIFLRIKLTRVYACHFCTCIFLTGGVYTPYSPCMSTPLITHRITARYKLTTAPNEYVASIPTLYISLRSRPPRYAHALLTYIECQLKVHFSIVQRPQINIYTDTCVIFF